MKINIKKRILKKAIESIIRAVAHASHLPVLEGILIDVTNSSVKLIASDGNLSIKNIIYEKEGLEIINPGIVLVPGRLFKEIISRQEDNIEISTKEKNMEIISGKNKANINLFEEKDYPIISFENSGKELVIESDVLKKIIKNVTFAAAVDDRRIILNGVNLVAKNGKMIANATNSFRLSREIVEINSTIEFNITILAKKIKDFLPLDAKGQIIIKVDDSKIISKIGNTVISSKIIEGSYPEIEKLLTNEFSSKIQTTSEELVRIIERVIVVSNETKKIVRLFTHSNVIYMESKESESGFSKSQLTNFKFSGENLDIAFNAHFLKEAISKFFGEIIIGFNGPNKQFVIKGKSNPNLTQIILPHRTF